MEGHELYGWKTAISTRASDTWKTVLIVISLLMLLLTPMTSSPTLARPPDWSTYVDQEYGFSVAYPSAGWQPEVTIHNPDQGGCVIKHSVTFSGPSNAEINVKVWNNLAGLDLMAWIEQYRELFAPMMATFLARPNAVVAGMPAIVLQDEETSQAPARVLTVLAKGEWVFALEYVAFDGGSALETYRQMLFGFAFLNEPEMAEDILPDITIPVYIRPTVSHCCGYYSAGNPFACAQCTWWARYKRPDLTCCTGSAKDWGGQARAAGYSPGSQPQEGAIVVFQPDVQGAHVTLGHVAYVEQVYSSSSVRVSEMNWDGSGCTIHYRTAHTGSGVEFIYLSGAVILDFTAELSGPPSDDQSAEVEVHVFQAGTDDLVFHDTVTTDNYGNYEGLTISGVTPGTYDIYVKPLGYLRRGMLVPLSTGENYVDFSNWAVGKLVAGDIDVYGGDNFVNSLDLGVWQRDYCPREPCPDTIADFNRDGAVNAMDLAHILMNWFGEGDGWIGFPSWSEAGLAHTHGSQVGQVPSDTGVQVDLTVSSGVNVGETVDVGIRIDGNNIPLDAIDVILEYDSCVFEVEDVQSGSVFSSISYEVDAASGLVRVFGDVGTGLPYTHDGYEIMATITLLAVASPESGWTDVQATVVDDSDDSGAFGTLDSNVVEHSTVLDAIGDGSFELFRVDGSPVKPDSVVTLTKPISNSYVNRNSIDLNAEVGGCSYAHAATFSYRHAGNGSWHTIDVDYNWFDGWNAPWDVSDLSDDVYDVKVWAGPWIGEGATATNCNVTVDRTPPYLEGTSFSPPSPSDADTVEIHAEASDNLAGVDHITVFHYRATDGSTSAELVCIGTITGNSGTVEWDTSQLPDGVYRIVFDIQDRASNWDLWTDGNQPEFTYRINRCTEVYLPLVLRNYTPSTEPPNRPPNTPSNPSPSDGATNQPITVTLSWTGGDPDGDSVTYDVYFEADDDTPDVMLSDDQSGTSYNPGTLSAGTRYYWQIVATDEHGATTTGPVWDFTTTASRTCYTRLNDDPTDYATVQAAVDAADEGDTVKVAGYCSGVEARTGVTQTVYISKSITLRGGYTTANWATSNPISHPTTLDAQGQGCVLYITGEISPIIEGLRITDGYASSGGGIYIVTATATISNNKVFSNTAFFGGGLLLQGSDAKIRNNTVTSNTAVIGGGLLLGSGAAMLAGNIVRSNAAEWYGGGLFLYESASTLTSNTISFNSADSGGGLDLHYSDAMISGNTLVANTAHEGGGLFLYETSPTLEENTIISNTAGEGGGLHIYRSDATFTNNVIADNQSDTRGSGLYIDRSLTRLLHSTIARNKGGDGSGVYVTSYGGSHSTIALTNTILVSHTVGISVTEGNTVTVNGVLWHSTPVTVSQVATTTVIVQNQHQGDPAFAADGYHLTVSSAAIDGGVDAGVTTDVDGDSRPQGAAFDLGADEYMSGATTHRTGGLHHLAYLRRGTVDGGLHQHLQRGLHLQPVGLWGRGDQRVGEPHAHVHSRDVHRHVDGQRAEW